MSDDNPGRGIMAECRDIEAKLSAVIHEIAEQPDLGLRFEAAADLVKGKARGVPAALCSHGPVLPDLVALLLERSDPSLAPGLVGRSVIEDALTTGLAKGEVLLVHVVGTGDEARIIAAERHHPRDRG